MSQLNNIRTVSVPSIGKLPLADKPGTFTPSGTKREHKPGRLAQDGGFTASSMPAKLELSLNLTPGLDIDAINAIENEDVTVRMADGSVYLLSQAFTSEPVAMDDGTSKVTILANTSERIS
ncbi:phage tail tube protein [Ralstonia sp. ASV6]|uniref:phage tail tube protein n=1 Tax=Ralstonia sp. ASV6 TaxID=2795124 RepID=UPI0018EE33C7